VDFLGGIDILVNNAGITLNRPFTMVTPEQFDAVFNVNIKAMFFACQAAAKVMLQQGAGVIVNTSSIHALEAYPEHTVYASTKGAINAFTRVLAIELAPHNIRVNAVVPGSIVVEAYYKMDAAYDPKAAGENYPAGFVGEPIDIAKAVLFLASEDSRYIFGQALVVDGGTTSWMPFGDGFKRPMTWQFGKDYVPGL
jgi:NAD(P)-dependent dehydrogenase (short-subunit alcohol dehydrogenase family)